MKLDLHECKSLVYFKDEILADGISLLFKTKMVEISPEQLLNKNLSAKDIVEDIRQKFLEKMSEELSFLEALIIRIRYENDQEEAN